MQLLTGILIIGFFVSLIALLFNRTKTNLTTTLVAFVLVIILAAITGNS